METPEEMKARIDALQIEVANLKGAVQLGGADRKKTKLSGADTGD